MWGEWSEPLWRVNPDVLTRVRKCDNPSPKNGGKRCLGSNKDTKFVTKCKSFHIHIVLKNN